MFSLKSVQTRFFDFERPDTESVLHIEPPKLKTLNKLAALAKGKETTPEELAEVLGKIISKNREREKVGADTVMDWLDPDQSAAFAQEFLGWLNKEKTSDPN